MNKLIENNDFINTNELMKTNELVKNIDKLHTTELGVERVKKNLHLETDDVVQWCRLRILEQNSMIERTGKNWYITADNCRITVNAYSYTIITAHKIRESISG